MLYNSLVDRKVPFVPAAGPASKQVTWYTCGECSPRQLGCSRALPAPALAFLGMFTQAALLAVLPIAS